MTEMETPVKFVRLSENNGVEVWEKSYDDMITPFIRKGGKWSSWIKSTGVRVDFEERSNDKLEEYRAIALSNNWILYTVKWTKCSPEEWKKLMQNV